VWKDRDVFSNTRGNVLTVVERDFVAMRAKQSARASKKMHKWLGTQSGAVGGGASGNRKKSEVRGGRPRTSPTSTKLKSGQDSAVDCISGV